MASRTKRYIAIDVECVATAIQHDARDVCSVAVVDVNERVILKKVVKPEKPVVSYLTPLTGVRPGDLDNGERLSDVIAEVKGLLGRDVVLVGQGLKSDIKWLQLVQGTDFADVVDLAELFKTYNDRYRNYHYYSLQHEVNTLIERGFISDEHDPANDAIASIKLFNKYYEKPALLREAKAKLQTTRTTMNFAKKNNYRWEGVCMAAYYPQKCFCGAPTLKS